MSARLPHLCAASCRELLADVRRLGAPSAATVYAPAAPVAAPAAEEPESAPDPFGDGAPPPAPGKVDVRDDGAGGKVVSASGHIDQEIHTPEELVAAIGLDLDVWEITNAKISTWAAMLKNAAHEAEVHRLWGVRISIKPRTIPLVPLAWAPPPVFVVPADLREPPPVRKALVLPDMQIGFRWRGLDEGRPWLEPYHDRRAIDLALQIAARVQPDHLIYLGDNLDLQELSTRWAFGDEARRTTALAIREWAWLLRRTREILPTVPIDYLEGNHEARLRKFLEERAGGLAEIRHHDGRKALGFRELLGLDELQVTNHPYPQPFWLWGRVEIEHGRVVRGGGGATAAAVMAKREHSVLYGHIHRAELAQRTVETPRGLRHVFAGSPGCLCRVDGVVPGSDRPDWQQGVAIVTSLDGGDEECQLVRFDAGRCLFGGEVLVGRDYVEELAECARAPALLPPEVRAA